jgi:hypothetical protein
VRHNHPRRNTDRYVPGISMSLIWQLKWWLLQAGATITSTNVPHMPWCPVSLYHDFRYKLQLSAFERSADGHISDISDHLLSFFISRLPDLFG